MSSNGKQKRQLFPEKLWELVNSQQGSGIRWSPSNNKCIEIERSKLERYLQTKFRSQNFDSFIRQLHFYGFKKCGNSYYHDKFQRDQPDRIHSMRRKYSLSMISASSGQQVKQSSQGSDVVTSQPSCSSTPVKASIGASSQESSKSGLAASTLNAPTPCHRAKSRPQPPRLKAHLEPPPAHQSKPWKEIKLYTVDATGDDDLCNFTNVREANARAIKDNEGHLKISIPKSLVSVATGSPNAHGRPQGAWPRSLVLECYKAGEQSVLSAFFVYRLN